MTSTPPEVNLAQKGLAHEEWSSPKHVDEAKARSAIFFDRLFFLFFNAKNVKKRPKNVLKDITKIFDLTAGLNQ